ncbi:hypothetical protein H8784_04635 [Parabacteroides acidifaciens]|uniref:Tetratricopeptide repeat protein n=1 Tax=Parabacteroides acidifaciens TaxID=2290935 RepID=A0A3D8HH07_9BACT|nr:hypothetical protein [Parabacteroides acidifaciens]MBC8601006.1 hypothetical protein [Parabacteroides acidifaciens]RDU50279.1 hypothetical protein DWU89_04715 [Parabacteroides acidifaciens]
MKDIIYGCLLSIALVLVSCEKQVASFPDYEIAETLLMEKPDSLAVLLEDRIDPALLPDSLKAEYGWWITRLHNRQRRSLMNDSVIHHTLHYFNQTGSPRLSYAYVLAGMQKNWAGDKPEEEIEYMKEGLQIAENLRDTVQFINIGSQLGRVYFLLNEQRQSIDIGNRVLQYTEKDSARRMTGLYMTGCSYAQLGKTDSVRLYMEEAIRLSQKLNSEMEFYIVRNYIDCLNAAGQSREVQSLLDGFYKRFAFKSDNDYPAKEFAYACLWLDQGKMDSVRACLDRLDRYGKTIVNGSDQNKYKISIIYVTKLLHTAYNIKMGRPVNLVDVYMTSEMVANWEANRMGIEQERVRTQNKLERNNLLLKIKEEQGRQLVLYILLAGGFVVAVLVYLYQRKLLKKERYLQQVKEQIRLHRIALNENEQLMSQNEETIRVLSAQLDEQGELSDQLHDRQMEIEQIRQENSFLLKEKQKLEQEMSRFMQAVPGKSIEMEAYERMTEQNMTFVTCAKQLSAILIDRNEFLKRLQKGEFKHLSDIDWPSVYKTLDQLFNNYTKRLRQNYPSLTEEDIQCCCLIKLQLSTSAIARLYGIAPSSVTKRKQRIKERINQTRTGLIGKEQPVDVYLWGY